MRGAGLLIVHIPVSDSYDIEELRELIFGDFNQ